jgi:phosphopantothenoylcysteine decarboxylase/phosphopantothenate--cysteine ligase
MASLTIRKLDDAIRDELRLRAARNGRSVEEEVRVILGELLQGRSESSATPSQAALPPAEVQPRTAPRAHATDQLRVTLIIGGGIAAYKALDLIRRLQERHIHVRCVLTRAAQQFVTPLSASALSNERCYMDLFDPESSRPAISVSPATAT